MDDRDEYARAGGSILAISIIAGTVAGIIVNQASMGFLVGTGAGMFLLAWFWLQERRRHPVRPDRTLADPAAGPDHPTDRIDLL